MLGKNNSKLSCKPASTEDMAFGRPLEICKQNSNLRAWLQASLHKGDGLLPPSSKSVSKTPTSGPG